MRHGAWLASAIVVLASARASAAPPDPSDAICESRTKKGSCACPSYTELHGAGNAVVREIRRGAFSAPGANEAVLEIVGCEVGARTAHTMTSHALVRLGPTGWKRASYEMGALGECKSIVARDGTERLVCRSRSGHAGLYNERISLFGWSSAAATENDEEVVGYWTDASTPLTTTAFEVQPPRLVLTVASGATRIPLVFSFDGVHFQAAPASKPQLALLNRLAAPAP